MSKKTEDFEKKLTGDDLPEADTSRSTWFKRVQKGILTKTSEKKEIQEGLWAKCPECKYTCTRDELAEHYYVCPQCNYHHRIGSNEYFDILFDGDAYCELFDNIRSKDFLGFTDLKPYSKRLEEIWKKSNLHDSLRVATGKVDGQGLVVCCMDFDFIGGSLGSVMGEKIARAVDFCIERKLPMFMICKSGGARMMESAFSLMQLAKISGKLTQLSDARLPYITYLTDPTFGGVTASFGMLGDLNTAEPGALIGFAGPRVIKETIKRDLPEGFQRSEFLLEHGFLDLIIDRKELKNKLAEILLLFNN
ncbi:MAG: acetyl-CoA carboxylase, carboxyltransferase subunit beta [Lacibacter sp.]